MINKWETLQLLDIHYHAGPDLYCRRHNAVTAGKVYQALNGAVILNSHLGSTSIQATLAQGAGLPVFPSLILNRIAGGINYRVVLKALAEYQGQLNIKLLVHFPTITGRNYRSKLSRQLVYPALIDETMAAQTVFNATGHLKKAVIDILKLAADYPIVISTGHASKHEIYALVDACEQYRVAALLLNQPDNPLTGLSLSEIKALSCHDFVWTEQTALTYLIGHQNKADFATVLKTLPRVIYSSDLGQPNQIDIADWYAFSQGIFDDLDISVTRRQELWLNNPVKLLTY